MYEQITTTLRRSVGAAAEFCDADQSPLLSVEHLIAAMLSGPENNASRVLSKASAEFPKLAAVQDSLKRSVPAPLRAKKPGMSADAKAVIQGMVEVGRRLQRSRVGTECLLLAVFDEAVDPAGRIASEAGTTCAALARSLAGEIKKLGDGFEP
jgi:ATP-dependent Clp protease ATP-binding subunit ClpA